MKALKGTAKMMEFGFKWDQRSFKEFLGNPCAVGSRCVRTQAFPDLHPLSTREPLQDLIAQLSDNGIIFESVFQWALGMGPFESGGVLWAPMLYMIYNRHVLGSRLGDYAKGS